MEKKIIKCDLSNVTISKDPNKMYITGCITKIGSPSDGVPCGAVSNCVFTQEAIDEYGQSWVNTPLNATTPEDWFDTVLSGHSFENIGVCTKVWADGDNCMAKFVVWKDRFPELADLIVCGMDSLGFSIECYSTAEHEDEDGNTVIDAFEGCGCAILWKAKAAFEGTFISELAAARRKDNMPTPKKKVTAAEEEEQKVEQTQAAEEEEKPAEDAPAEEEEQEETDASSDKFENIESKLDALMSAIAGLTEAVAAANKKCEDTEEEEEQEEEAPAEDEEDEEKEAADEEEEKDETKASKSKKNIPAPKTQYSAARNPNFDNGKDISAEVEKINASAMSPIAKLREITKLRIKH